MFIKTNKNQIYDSVKMKIFFIKTLTHQTLHEINVGGIAVALIIFSYIIKNCYSMTNFVRRRKFIVML